MNFGEDVLEVNFHRWKIEDDLFILRRPRSRRRVEGRVNYSHVKARREEDGDMLVILNLNCLKP